MCDETATVEAIGSYEGPFGHAETIVMHLCDAHAMMVKDDVLVLL